MARCKVYGNKPDNGPGRMAAKAALDEVNEENPTWDVTKEWTEDNTVYTSATATYNHLQAAFEARLPGYNFMDVT